MLVVFCYAAQFSSMECASEAIRGYEYVLHVLLR